MHTYPYTCSALPCRALYSDKPERVPLVEAELIFVELTSSHSSTGRPPGRHAALVMPVYADTVAKLLRVGPAVILAQGKRIQAALEFVHSRGFVHMDVKVRTRGGVGPLHPVHLITPTRPRVCMLPHYCK